MMEETREPKVFRVAEHPSVKKTGQAKANRTEPKGKKRVRKETKDIHEISENSFKRHKSSESDFITLDQ